MESSAFDACGFGGVGQLMWKRAFPGKPNQISQVRNFVRALLTGHPVGGLALEEAELVASELAANAVRHTASGDPGGAFMVKVAITNLVHIAVVDQGGQSHPAKGAAGLVADAIESGRGLAMVADLAFSIGVHGSPELGYQVWADLVPERPTPRRHTQRRPSVAEPAV